MTFVRFWPSRVKTTRPNLFRTPVALGQDEGRKHEKSNSHTRSERLIARWAIIQAMCMSAYGPSRYLAALQTLVAIGA
jgi:hypothetical protein